MLAVAPTKTNTATMMMGSADTTFAASSTSTPMVPARLEARELVSETDGAGMRHNRRPDLDAWVGDLDAEDGIGLTTFETGISITNGDDIGKFGGGGFHARRDAGVDDDKQHDGSDARRSADADDRHGGGDRDVCRGADDGGGSDVRRSAAGDDDEEHNGVGCDARRIADDDRGLLLVAVPMATTKPTLVGRDWMVDDELDVGEG